MAQKIGPREWKIPPGDDKKRLVCPECKYVEYVNPRIVVGVVAVASDERILLGKRTIEPRSGFWTMPAGFLELGETPLNGAKRECFEEMCAEVEIDQLIAVYHVEKMGQIHLMYRGKIKDDVYRAGHETSDVKLVKFEEIDFSEIAFPTVEWAIRHYHETKNQSDFQPRSNPSSNPNLKFESE